MRQFVQRIVSRVSSRNAHWEHQFDSFLTPLSDTFVQSFPPLALACPLQASYYRQFRCHSNAPRHICGLLRINCLEFTDRLRRFGGLT
jgi:hypothetical protein